MGYLLFLAFHKALQGILTVIIFVSTRNCSRCVSTGLVELFYLMRRFYVICGDRVTDIRIVTFACQNGILTTAFQRFRRIFLRTAQDPKAASERLYRILALLNNSIDQNACIRTDRGGFMLEVWNVPVAIILVFSRHITWNNAPVFWSITAFVGADEVPLFVINIDLFFTCPDFNFLPEIFSRHAVMDLVEGKRKVLGNFHSLSFEVFKGGGWRWQKNLFFLFVKEIVTGVRKALEWSFVFHVYLFYQDMV